MMIASYKHNFIFIRTHKTASTSTELILGSWTGPEDIVAPIGPPEHEMLRAEFGGGRSQNFCSNPALEQEYIDAVTRSDLKAIDRVKEKIKKRNALRYRNHMPAIRVKQLLPDLWSKAYKFAVDRHPYEKVLSRAWNATIKQHDGDIGKFPAMVDQVIDRGRAWNHEIYMDGDTLLVDKLFRYEDIWNELKRLSEEYDCPYPEVLPRARGEHPRAPKSANEMLSKSQKKQIADAVPIEFDLLGYER